MEFIDENQMVFIDASNGEESIELVNHSIETESSNEAISERKDIVEVLFNSLLIMYQENYKIHY